MKLQFLGDAKDSFKWDYHDYLTDKLGFEVLNILLMMTPDDKTNHGKLKATLFPARKFVPRGMFQLLKLSLQKRGHHTK